MDLGGPADGDGRDRRLSPPNPAPPPPSPPPLAASLLGRCTAVDRPTRDGCGVASPCRWLRRLSRELHWSFLLTVFAVYGACQGVGNAVGVVAATYYCKDVLRVQPAAAQFYQGIVDAPWVVKPLWAPSVLES